MKTETIRMSHLRDDEHFQLNTEFSDAVNRFNAQILKIKPQFDIYVPLFEQEVGNNETVTITYEYVSGSIPFEVYQWTETRTP